MDDYRKWLSSGEYGMAIVQFRNDYSGVADVGVRYCHRAALPVQGAGREPELLEGRGPARVLRDGGDGRIRDHFLALAKSIATSRPATSAAAPTR
jgi:hypothetical protein